jgi:hypothetical protein
MDKETIEIASFLLTIIVLVLQALNVYVMRGVKLWSLETFVTKSEFQNSLSHSPFKRHS